MEFNKKEKEAFKEIQKFVKGVFIEGTVPDNIEDFLGCISDETTDGSRCFVNQFGETEKETVMLFFYPFTCAVPYVYQKYLKSNALNRMQMLNLDYQEFLVKSTNSSAFLLELKTFMEETYLFKYYSIISSSVGKRDTASYMEGVSMFENKHREVLSKINDKLAGIVKGSIISVCEENE